MRCVEIDDRLAILLGRLRALARRERWYQAPADEAPAPLRGFEIEALENELGVVMPEPALAYVAAGVSVWGDGPLTLGDVREKTLLVRELYSEQRERAARGFIVIDDDSNGNYIAIKNGTPKKSDRVYFLDHEESYALSSPLSLTRAITEKLEQYGGANDAAAPFVTELSDEAPPVAAPVLVHHAKFGVGRVVADDGEHVTVAFEGVGDKRLKRSFVRFE